jgi:RNA polymerase sigma-70 factor (ECF subfamily)
MGSGVALSNVASAISGVRPEEAAILVELRAGSEEAFSALMTQYQQPIYSLVARTIRNPSDAPDLTQEIFLKVFRGIRSFKGDSSLRTWIYRIAVHESSNQGRWWRRHREREVALDAECYSQTGDTEGLTCAIEAVLREVPEPYRTTVVLRDIEGFAYEEVAEILNIQLGTVKSRLMRGRAHLKQRLAPLMASRIQARRNGGAR